MYAGEPWGVPHLRPRPHSLFGLARGTVCSGLVTVAAGSAPIAPPPFKVSHGNVSAVVVGAVVRDTPAAPAAAAAAAASVPPPGSPYFRRSPEELTCHADTHVSFRGHVAPKHSHLSERPFATSMYWQRNITPINNIPRLCIYTYTHEEHHVSFQALCTINILGLKYPEKNILSIYVYIIYG